MTDRVRRKDRVLLVAPHDEDTMLLAGLLTTAGYGLSTVFDVETALALCAAGMPDHAIIDLATPGLDGVALAQRLRALDGTRALRIVAIGDTRDGVVDACVPRPATITRLIDALGAAQRERA